jgi:hypothetical protein
MLQSAVTTLSLSPLGNTGLLGTTRILTGIELHRDRNVVPHPDVPLSVLFEALFTME